MRRTPIKDLIFLLIFSFSQRINPATFEVYFLCTSMAEVVAISENESVVHNGKITGLVVLSCITAATGAVLYGYDNGVTSGVNSMAPFLQKFFPEVYRKMQEVETSNYCKFDSQLLTFFTSSLYITGLITSFFASRVTLDYGRKRSIIIGGVAYLVGAILGGAAENIYMLIFGRLLLGVGIGFTNQSIPLYLSEMAPPRYRGAFGYGFQFCVAIGTIMAMLINYGTEKIKGDLGWRISLSAAVLPALILILGTIFLPETPNSLIQRGQDQEKARKILQKIRGTNEVQQEFNELITASHQSSKISERPFKKIVLRKYRPHLVMSIAIPFFQQVTGITVISFYAPILFRTIGSNESLSLLSSLITAMIGTIMTILSSLMVDKLGRRVLFFIGGVEMLITQVMIGGIMAAKLGDHGALGKGYSDLVLMLIFIFDGGFGFSWGPLGWLVPSEIFPLEIRSAAQSITVAVSFFFSFLTGQVYLAMLCHLKAATFFFFGGLVAIMTCFVYFLLPETKNISIETMEKIWREHSFWRRFVCDDQEWNENKLQEPFLHHSE